jgi:signal transduction histidine kinase
MTDRTAAPPRTPLLLRFAVGIVLIVVLSLWAFYLIMQPTVDDLMLMAIFLSITAVISALASLGAYRMGWITRSPTIRWTLIGSYILASVLTFINVWMTATLMFASEHDLLLATVLLIFAGGIAIAMGFFISTALTDRIKQLDQAARSIAAGDLAIRIPEEGQDEIADLAQTFNQMAARLQTADSEKHRAEKLRRDLIAWVSHDLQTPLTSIRARIEALADGMVDDPDTIQRYLRTAQKDIAALSLLIDDLFHVAQLDAGGLQIDCQYNSITDLVSDTIESFSELANRKGVGLKGSIQPDVDPVWMDAPRIGRALNNLVANALHHTPEGGLVELRVNRLDSSVTVEVHDTGAGIKDEDLPHIFESFYRGEKSRSRLTGGAGLGLAITKGIIEAHQGQIGVESCSEQGTCFSFTIPGVPTSGE